MDSRRQQQKGKQDKRSCARVWRVWEPADLLITLVPDKVRARSSGRKQERGRGSGDSHRREVAAVVGTPGWPRRPWCRSRRGPLATRVNTDDFSVCPYELTLLGETQEAGLQQ